MNKVAIYGGLGNQMFQYSLSIALNHKGNKTRICFSNFLFRYHHDGFNLCDAFRIRLVFPLNILNLLLSHGKPLYKNRLAGFILKRVVPPYESRPTGYIEKQEFVFDQQVFGQHDRLFVGIWQSVFYFADIKEIISREFEFRRPSDKANSRIIDHIINTQSVSIHIRRGDYLKERWRPILGVIQGMTYYKNAINYISEKVNNPCYFVFSDDISWARENLKLENCIFVDQNKGSKSYLDMYLMSICKHNIIANSTFSWWAAWLNKNTDRIVIIPDKWIVDKECEGMYPEDWIRMETN
ncbi:MAG: alpha-1,2-fucosyltransferase [Bacteroidales bacterium]|nr:alpha-1,2-fucosyltransferase [Bacteroidales bacterium]